MSNFTTIALANDLVLVEGTDARNVFGQTTVDAREWNHMLKVDEVKDAHEAFDAALEEFFAPITEAAELASEAHKVVLDPLLYVVVQEEVNGVQAEHALVRTLEQGTVILRAISTGATDRLIWVNGELVLTAHPVAPVPPVTDAQPVADDAEVVGTEPTA